MTPLGEIPTDWEMKRLGEVGSFSKGGGISKLELSEEGLPCIRYGEIYTTHDYIIKEFKSFISEDVSKLSKRIYKGDILFAGSGETLEDIGKAVAFIGEEEAFSGGDIIIFSPTKDEVQSESLAYMLDSYCVRKQRARLGVGTQIVHIYAKDLKTILIPVPPLSEQKTIAKVLSTWDEAIEKNQQLIDQKELRKKALMQQLLTGKKRLKGFSGEWKHKTLGDVAVLKVGKTPSRSNEAYWNSPNPQNVWISISDMKNVVLIKSKEYLSNLALEECKINKVQKGTLLMSFKLTLGKMAWAGCDLFTNEAIVAIYPQKTKVTDKLLFYILPQAVEKSDAGQAVKGKTLNQEHLQNLAFKIPKLAEQKAIAEILLKAEAEIELEKQKLEQLKLQKKALMQVLLTGKKRIIGK